MHLSTSHVPGVVDEWGGTGVPCGIDPLVLLSKSAGALLIGTGQAFGSLDPGIVLEVAAAGSVSGSYEKVSVVPAATPSASTGSLAAVVSSPETLLASSVVAARAADCCCVRGVPGSVVGEVPPDWLWT